MKLHKLKIKKRINWLTKSVIQKITQHINALVIYPKISSQLSETPIIIGGCGRSGTTLLLSILSASPKICAIPEETYAFAPTSPKKKVNIKMAYSQLATQAIPTSCTRFCEKTPKNVLHFKEIIEYFKGNVKIIHIVRDGRDVILSTHPSSPNKYHVSMERWITDVSKGLEVEGAPQVITIKYEDLINKFEKTIKKLMNFIGEDVDYHIIQWNKYAKVRESDAWHNGKVKPLFKKSIHKWKQKKYSNRINSFLKRPKAKKLLQKLRYLD